MLDCLNRKTLQLRPNMYSCALYENQLVAYNDLTQLKDVCLQLEFLKATKIYCSFSLV